MKEYEFRHKEVHKKYGLSWNFDAEWCVVNYNNFIKKNTIIWSNTIFK